MLINNEQKKKKRKEENVGENFSYNDNEDLLIKKREKANDGKI